LLFASHREAVGRSTIEIDVPERATLSQLFEELESQSPGLSPLRPFTTYAVNREVAPPSTVLHDGDEVALLQPVSGGEK
jgi:molybdopterin converting factor small subunit